MFTTIGGSICGILLDDSGPTRSLRRERSQQGLAEEHRAKSQETMGDDTCKGERSRTDRGQRLARDGALGEAGRGMEEGQSQTEALLREIAENTAISGAFLQGTQPVEDDPWGRNKFEIRQDRLRFG